MRPKIYFDDPEKQEMYDMICDYEKALKIVFWLNVCQIIIFITLIHRQ